MSDASAILDRLALAHALLSAGRTRFALARDQGNLPVELEAPEAVQFCLMGAVHRAIFERESPVSEGITRELLGLMGRTFEATTDYVFPMVTHWHDLRATAQVLALLEECAARVNPK